MQTATAAATTPTPIFTITRIFDAPRDIVWKAWTDAALFAQWFGPKGYTCKILKHELGPGGLTHSYLKSPDGAEMYGKFVYREVKEPSKLSWTHSFTDASGNHPTRHPFSPTWPLELSTNVTFEDEGQKTKVTLTWTPYNATDKEIETFAAGMDSMKQGWGGTFEQLDEFLAKSRG